MDKVYKAISCKEIKDVTTLNTDSTLTVDAGGTDAFQVTSSGIVECLDIKAKNSGGYKLSNSNASATSPTLIPDRNDGDTGIGTAAADSISIIAGAIEGIRLTEASSGIIEAHMISVGLTADTGSAQGGQPLTSSYNVIGTCANAGDSVTLPATFVVGTIVKIKNDGAESSDVFPASGDDLGAGADTAAALAAGASITYIATAANSTWTSIGN